ncbi:hypothetical protein B566_EDAN010007 [Ephemera danica]|nr:hypothetical protein B566_EDAN010007 [Ephemera danica]
MVIAIKDGRKVGELEVYYKVQEGFVLSAYAFSKAEAEEMEEPKAMLRTLPWPVEIFMGGQNGHGSNSESMSASDESGSGSGEADKKYTSKDKITEEIQIILKRIAKLERQFEFCRSRKTCKEITDELLGSFSITISDAATCVSRAFKTSSSSSSSNNNNNNNNYDSGSYSREF